MPNYYGFEGRVALVTGGASGIGAATVERLRAGGAEVHVFDLANGDDVRDSAQLDAAVASYAYPDTYRAWPGPNSNTFLAHLGRAMPELRLTLPSTAIGKDYLPLGQFLVRTPSGTGGQASILGLVGVAVGVDEGFELNILGLVAGIDFARPALKLPGVGRVPDGD